MGTKYYPVVQASITGTGNAITSVSVSNGSLTATKDSTFLTEHQDISGKVNRSGDTFTGKVQFVESDGNCIGFNSIFTVNQNGGSTLVGVDSSANYFGLPSKPMRIRGSGSRPQYAPNGGTLVDMALYSDVPSTLPVTYVTEAPTAANTTGLKFAVLTSEPATKYAGWVYLITEA